MAFAFHWVVGLLIGPESRKSIYPYTADFPQLQFVQLHL